MPHLSPRKKLLHRIAWAVFELVCLVSLGCSNGSGNAGNTDGTCQPGASRSCTAPSGCTGVEPCNAEGTGYGACSCAGSDLRDGGKPPSHDAQGDAASTVGTRDAGSTPDAAPICPDVCDVDAPASCNDGVLQSCWRSPFDGCSNALTSTCPRKGCGDENHCAECVNECSNGETGCKNGAIGSCVRDAEGCFKWQRNEECSSGFCADATTCGNCVNACPTVGETTCQDGLSQVCVADRYGCRSYLPWTECPVLQCASSTQCLGGYSLGQRGTTFDDEALAVFVDERGVVATAGTYHQFGTTDYNADSDAYIQARSADGTLLKDARWGSPADDSALAIAVDSQFNHLVTGWTAGKIDVNPHRGGRDAFLAKWGDDYTKPIWVRQWGTSENDLGRALVVDRSDNAFVVGSTGGQLGSDPALGADDIFITKWDSMGNRLWTKQLGTELADVATAATLDVAGHLWIAGRTAGNLAPSGSLGGYDAFFAELDVDGKVIFVKQIGSPKDDSAQGIAIDADGNVFVAGFTQDTLDGNPSTGGIDAFVAKLSHDGTPIWSKLWGTTSDDFTEGLALDLAGNPYIAVSSMATAGPACPPGQAWAVGWDSNGGTKLAQLWDSCGVDAAHAIATKPDGQILVVGSTTGDFAHDNRGGKDIISITLQPN